MVRISDFIIENYERFGLILLFLILLGLTGNITRLIRGAKNGLKETFTPLGFFVFAAIVYLVILVVQSV